MLLEGGQAVVQKIEGHLVHVEDPLLVAMGTKKEWMDLLQKFACLNVHHRQRMLCLVHCVAFHIVVILHEATDGFEASIK